VALLLTFLAMIFALSSHAQTAKEKGDLRVGKAVYEEICFACHGLKGDGKGPGWRNTNPSPQVFINSEYMSRLTDDYMFNVVKYGKLRAIKKNIPDKDLPTIAMPSFEGVLEEQQIWDLIEFERAFSQGGAQSAEMREIYDAACMICHGKQGKGNGETATAVQPPPKYFVSDVQPSPMNLADPQLMARFSDEFMYNLIKYGKIGVVEKANFDTMQPFGQVLSDKEIWSVIRYIRETFIEPNKK